jgi:hypothetical protein
MSVRDATKKMTLRPNGAAETWWLSAEGARLRCEVPSQNLKLAIELVPQPLWGQNPRLSMGRSEWDRLRKEVYGQYNNRCGVCGASGRLEAHEIWEYEDVRLIQRLAGLIALCTLCHQVKHLGRTGILAKPGKADVARLVRHFMDVNECSRKDFEDHLGQVLETWKRRSKQPEWSLDWGPYSHLMK